LQVAGLVAWPLDGHPSQTVGLVAHSGGVVALAVSCDGRRLLTASADGLIAAWDADPSALGRVPPLAPGTVGGRWVDAVR
jgi:WD40 repeat protein